MAGTLNGGRGYPVAVPILYGVTGLAVPGKFTRRQAGGYLGGLGDPAHHIAAGLPGVSTRPRIDSSGGRGVTASVPQPLVSARRNDRRAVGHRLRGATRGYGWELFIGNYRQRIWPQWRSRWCEIIGFGAGGAARMAGTLNGMVNAGDARIIPSPAPIRCRWELFIENYRQRIWPQWRSRWFEIIGFSAGGAARMAGTLNGSVNAGEDTRAPMGVARLKQYTGGGRGL